MSFLILFYANQLISSLSVFTATMWATIKRTVPSTTAHTVTSPCQGTLNIYVCSSNIIFARIRRHFNWFCPDGHCNSCNTFGHMLNDCLVENLILEQAISIFARDCHQVLLQQGSVHIEPGSQLYKGGNIMVLFLGASLFLISTEHAISYFLEFISYAYYHYLLILGPSTFTVCML